MVSCIATFARAFRRGVKSQSGRLFRGVALAFFIVATTAVPSVLAKSVHGYSTSFGAVANPSPTAPNPYPLSNPTDVAVDNSSGDSAHDVYVTDPTNHRIEKFDSAGDFILMFGKEVNATTGEDVCTAASGDVCQAGASGTLPGELDVPTFIAVDGSSGLSSGDVYVGDTGDDTVSKFDSSGRLITSWGVEGQLNEFVHEFSLDGIAVDLKGNLFVVGEPEPATFWYDQSGASEGSFAHPRGTSPEGLAVDSEDHLYKADGFPEVSKFGIPTPPATEDNLGEPDRIGQTTGLTINPLTNDLFTVEEGAFVDRFAVNCGEGCSPIETFGSGKLKGAQGIGLDKSSGTAYVADAAQGDVVVFREGIQPEAVTESAEEVGLTTAVLHGHLDPSGGAHIGECHFEYGTTESYGLGDVPCEPPTPFGAPADVTAKISGLVNNTTYHFRLAVSNEEGIPNSGQDRSFTTPPAVDDLSAEPATMLSASSATINGSWLGEKEDTHYHFEWGFTTLYGKNAPLSPVDAGATEGQTDVSAPISDLNPTATYHYRLVAENAKGVTYSPDQSFTTLAYPAIAGLPTTEYSVPRNEAESSSVEVNAEINPEDGGPTTYHVEYGPTESYGSSTVESAPVGSDDTGHLVSSKISGLSVGITYHFRFVVTSAAGTVRQPDQTFTTLPILPTVAGVSASQVSKSGATLDATIKPGLGPTVYLFDYGSSSSYGSSTMPSAPIGSDNTDHSVATEITGLKPATTYHYRVVAINFAGVVAGLDQTFTTKNVPSIFGASSAGVTRTSATLTAEIAPGFSSTAAHFEFGPETSYGSSTPQGGSLGSDDSVHSTSATINGLQPGTLYHFRVIATNSEGTTIGSDQSFTTQPLEEGGSPPSKNGCGKRRILRHHRCVRRLHRSKHRSRRGRK